jgi:hypothetical protein
VRPPHGEVELSAESRKKIVSTRHSLSRDGRSREVVMEFILLDDVSTGIPFSVFRRNIVLDAVACYLKPQLYKLDVIRPWFVRPWLDSCEAVHDSCRAQRALGDREVPMVIDLIDVEKGCLVEATTAARYVALSYVNGPVRGFETTRATRARLGEESSLFQQRSLAAVVRHAMIYTVLIGERFLWVDTLCIVQDDLRNKHNQIAQMDQIYSSALVTFVSLGRGADEGLPWVEGEERHIRLLTDAILPIAAPQPTTVMARAFRRLKKSPFRWRVNIILNPPITPEYILPFTTYESRGWTCQERLLSTRILYFSRWQLYAQCRQSLMEEHLYQGSDIGNDNPLYQLQPAAKVNEFGNLSQYGKIVTDYTRRSLSFTTDILNAFAGIARVLETMMATSLCYGLPEAAFHQALFWIPSTRVVRRTIRPDLKSPTTSTTYMPSWSWAGWEGQVHYMSGLYSLVRPDEYGFRSEVTEWDEESNPSEQLSESSSFRVDDAAGLQRTALRFQAWTIDGTALEYMFSEQQEESPLEQDGIFSRTLAEPVLMCPLIQPGFSVADNAFQSETSASDMSWSSGTSGGDSSASTDEITTNTDGSTTSSDRGTRPTVIGRAWLTYESSQQLANVHAAEHSWVLLGKEKGYHDHDGRLRTFPHSEDFVDSSNSLLEPTATGELRPVLRTRHGARGSVGADNSLPWAALLMLIRWEGVNAERVAVAYVDEEAWDAIVRENGAKRTIRLI